MFFEIMRIVKENRPKVLFFENVRHLIKHDDGRTFATVRKSIEDQGYTFNYKIVKDSDFNLPQHRPRYLSSPLAMKWKPEIPLPSPNL